MSGPPTLTRRTLLGVLGTLSASKLLLGRGRPAAREGSSGPGPAADRGLAKPGDVLLAPGLVYLQTGTLGPTPRPVLERTVEAWREMERNPAIHAYREFTPRLHEVRVKAAAFLGARVDDVVITRNTTEGMNLLAQGLDLQPGDRLLTTDQEHRGGLEGWTWLARRRGVGIDKVAVPPGESDAGAILERFRKALTPRTRVLSFSHILFSTGLRMPVADLCALAREKGILSVVDGAQAPGGIVVDVKALGCDAYATSGHKWLLGPKGTGLLILNEAISKRLDALPLQDGRKAFTEATGTANLPGILGLGHAMDHLTALGLARIEAHNLALRNDLYGRLQALGLRMASPPPGPLASPLVTVVLPDRFADVPFGRLLLDRHQVFGRGISKELFPGLRFSCHLFNSPEDLGRAEAALKAELG